MILLHISRHKTRVYTRGQSVTFGVGEQIETLRLNADAVPRVGDLVTVHPDLSPSENSWTARVTGVQHVFATMQDAELMRHTQHRVCVTVTDEKETD